MISFLKDFFINFIAVIAGLSFIVLSLGLLISIVLAIGFAFVYSPWLGFFLLVSFLAAIITLDDYLDI